MSRHTKIHITWLIAYIALTPIAYFLGLLNSVAFVSILSVWALVEGRWSTVEASRTKDALDKTKQNDKAD